MAANSLLTDTTAKLKSINILYMKHNIIKTENYLLVVDESEIKEGDWCLADIPAGDFYGIVKYNGAFAKHYYKKIIAHLPINNSPILEGVDLLPPLEDDEAICPYPEEMYSEEDMKSFGEFCADYDYRCFGKHTQEEMLKIWFEQFKKK
jgi:hypothetical protein